MVPLTRKPPGTGSARVRTEARSEPESGSLMPIEKKHSPAVMRGRIAWRCSSLPKRSSSGPDWRSATQWAPAGALLPSSSSVTT